MKTILLSSIAAMLVMTGCNNETKAPAAVPEVKTFSAKQEEVSYQDGNTTLKSFVVYDANIEGPRPAILVIPEWWGLTDYVKNRARQLAELGYIAIAVDMYGDGRIAATPDSAKAYATPFYMDSKLAQGRFDAALAKLKSYSQTDTSRLAAIGYCFGGAMALNMARLGENLRGVVSFHGNLAAGVPVDKQLLKAQVLVCHGGADPFVPAAEVAQFKKQMDSIGAKYIFREYAGATHAFTNPQATETGKKFNMPISYNAAADSSSWADMKSFFNDVLK